MSDLENGPNTAFARRRLFGQEADQAERVVFYRDASSWCAYCQKVWLTLETKRIPYTVEKINLMIYGAKPAWYFQIVPSGAMPALVVDGQVLTDSDQIVRVLDVLFPENPLLPTDFEVRVRAKLLLRLEQKHRECLLRLLLSDPSDSWALQEYEAVLGEIDSSLCADSSETFALGPSPSLPDCVLAPFMERAEASLLYARGFVVRDDARWPSLSRWLNTLDTWPVYIATKADMYNHAKGWLPVCVPLEAPRTVGLFGEPRYLEEAEGVRAECDGTDASWDYIHCVERPASIEAGARLVLNRAKVVEFALRETTNSNSKRLFSAVENSLRRVASRLVCDALGFRADSEADIDIDEDDTSDTISALAWLRDRVGVPRDMRSDAAQALRQALNWQISSLGGNTCEKSDGDGRTFAPSC
eukprot:gnl/TRDRNA2_/TRDRNA2_33287_c0_seq1.p1 gnl/TRDRNA2_/TRDRNA2_33287_c0~~gnl/TRDRNA2_/TRDRNA2_33287_c0_seq1.p1  ORF type:complete len:415 (+),score=46.38 gnl/TRDRNA2_/TRDRNA2_33287_c0_seq1:1-1245(+)